MTTVVGTAGHIDHGKTALLRSLTGIDADRLPEERRRGMTIDVGYAHMALADGTEIDFVDVPGHDRLVGNMLVGAGEIDAALLVVAADDGPRAQTLEHLELLDALEIPVGLVTITKADLVTDDRLDEVARAVRTLLEPSSLAGSPILAVSAISGVGLDALRAELGRMPGRVAAARRSRQRRDPAADDAQRQAGPPRIAVDRAFQVRGRGLVVTGSLRGGSVARGDILRAEPSGDEVRVRELQVHGAARDRLEGGGRVALNVAGTGVASLRRGDVLTSGPGVERTDRLLVVLRPRDEAGLRHGLAVRVHLGTDQVDGTLDMGRRASVPLPGGQLTAIIRLSRPVAAAFGDALVLRRPSPAATLAGGRILDPLPPRGVSRRRVGTATLATLAASAWGTEEQITAIVALHGSLPVHRARAWAAVLDGPMPDQDWAGECLAPDVADALRAAAVTAVSAGGSVTASDLRSAIAADCGRRCRMASGRAQAVGDAIVTDLVARGVLTRHGDRVLPPGASAGPSEALRAAMDRLVAALAVPAPPSLREAAMAARCSIDGIRALERDGRIIRVEDDLAWESATLARFERLATSLAAAGPVAPAAFRDASGTSRRYALAILEDLDRRGILRRTPGGHVLGPRALAPVRAQSPA